MKGLLSDLMTEIFFKIQKNCGYRWHSSWNYLIKLFADIDNITLIRGCPAYSDLFYFKQSIDHIFVIERFHKILRTSKLQDFNIDHNLSESYKFFWNLQGNPQRFPKSYGIPQNHGQILEILKILREIRDLEIFVYAIFHRD